jgi:hypothetical protein
MTSLKEAEHLARECLELAIDLMPEGERMPTASDARHTGNLLLKNLRAIQCELRLAVHALPVEGEVQS